MYSFEVLLVIVCAFAFAGSTPFKTRIINGTEVTQVIPWVARIFLDYESTPAGTAIETNCGGSLIKSQWVLTAKHCLLDNNTKELSNEYHVGLGSIDYVTGQIIKSDKHYFYSTENHIDHDICLLHLESAPEGIDPIPYETEDNLDYEGKTATLYGWGLTDPKNDNSDVRNLRTTKVILEARSQCSKDAICFDPKTTQTNSCEGDSGGPMTLDIDGTETLVGVTHVGQVINDIPCTGDFSSYTSTGYYAEWIQDTIAQNS